MWWFLSVAYARPDGLEVWRFLDWHCAAPPRLAEGIALVDLPAAPPLDDGEAWERRVGVPLGPMLTLGAPGDVPADYEVIVVEPATPAREVADRLAALAEPLRAPTVRWLAFGWGGEVEPRPEPPVAPQERDRFAALEAELRPPGGGSGDAERWEEVRAQAAGRCLARAPAVGDRCAEARQRWTELLRDRSCRADLTAALAWWASALDPGEGRPVRLVPVRAAGHDQISGPGTWADIGAAAARLPDLSMAPVRSEDRTGYVPFRVSELTLQRRVPADYPESERGRTTEQRCNARIWLDATGVPERVEVGGCDEPFLEPARIALMAWRWYPPRLGPVHVRAVTSVVITFRRER